MRVLAEVLGAAMAVLVAVLPPPPDKVVRETPSYGTITIDHKAHLALRVACRACHGPGRVGKIDFTPRSGHAACRDCHIEMARGPTSCRGCHVVAPKSERAVAAEPAAGAPEPTVVAMASGAAASVHMTSHAAGAPNAAGGTPGPPPPLGTPFARTVELGLNAVVGEHQDVVFGPSVQLMARSGSTVMAYTLAVAGGSGDGRTRFLVGGGREFTLRPGVRAAALAVGGLDATHAPVSAMPALGLRAGIELLSQTRTQWSMGLSVTALTDLVRSGAMGDQTGGTTVGFTMSASHPLTR